MLKRICLLVLALMLAVPALADTTVWEAHAARLAQELPQLSVNETYIEIYGGYFFVLTYKEALDALSAQTWTQPLRDVYLSVDMEALDRMAAAEKPSEELLALYEQSKEYVQGMLPGSLMMQALDNEGILIMSSLQNHLYFLDAQEPDGTAYFIRFYADGTPMFFLHATHDGVGSLQCYPLPDAALAECTSAADVQAWLAAADIPQLLVAHDEPQRFALYEMYEADGSKGLDRMACDLVQGLPAHVNDPLWQTVLMQGNLSTDILAAWMHAGDEAPVLMAHTQLDAQVQVLNMWGLNAAALMMEEESPAQRLLRSSVPMNVASGLILREAGEMVYVTVVNMNVGSVCYNPDQPDGLGMYIFVYEDGRAACAVWHAEDGFVDMSAMPLPVAEIAECRSAAALTMWFGTHYTPMAFAEVVPE